MRKAFPRIWPVLPLMAIMAAALAVRLYHLSKYTEYTTDSYYFMILARSIKDTFTYTVRGVTHTKYLPGFPIAIWLGSYLLGGLEKSANFVAVAGGTLTVGVTYLIGSELWNRWTGLAAALVLAFQPTFLKWTSLPMTEGMFTFFFSLGVYLVLRGCRRGSPALRALGAASGGVCMLTRWEGALFLPLAVLTILLYRQGSGLRWWEPLLMLVLFAGPVGVFVLRNKIATGSLTAYSIEYEQHSELTFVLLRHRLKAYAWQGMSGAFYPVLFYLGAAWCLVRRKWRQFLLVGAWFAGFVILHMFWYYTYERFMAPAAPAVAMMIGFFTVDLAVGVRELFGPEGRLGGRLRRSAAAEASDFEGRAGAARRARLLSVTLRFACYVLLAGLMVVLVAHGLVRAGNVIAVDRMAFADDHGGRGMAQAARWLEENAPGRLVAVDAGPYFDWEYDADVLYVRPVPWDLPVEDRDVGAPCLAEKLYQRGVRYLVIGQTEEGVEAELATIGMRPEDLARLRQVAGWVNRYSFPEPHELTTVIFEVLPPS